MTNDNYGLLLRLDDMVNGYVEVARAVRDRGGFADPRGLPTREVLGATIIVPATAPMLPVKTGRGVNLRLAAVEALQVIGGYSDASALLAINAHLGDFADQGVFHGAYGPRIRPQVELVVRRLREDPESRRAVVSIWDPLRDSIEGVKNYPCTTELQFMLRPTAGAFDDELALDLHVTMRANDAWHGLAYDAFVFSQLQATVARVLDRPVGMYIHHAASLHLYEEHLPLVDTLHDADGPIAAPPAGLTDFQRARMVGDGSLVFSSDPSEAWYLEKTSAPVTSSARSASPRELEVTP